MCVITLKWVYFPTVSSKGYIGGQKNTFLSLSYTFPLCPPKGMLMDKRTLLSVFTKKCEFICATMAPQLSVPCFTPFLMNLSEF